MVLPTLFQVFGQPCYTKLSKQFELFAFFAHFSKAREFLRK